MGLKREMMDEIGFIDSSQKFLISGIFWFDSLTAPEKFFYLQTAKKKSLSLVLKEQLQNFGSNFVKFICFQIIDYSKKFYVEISKNFITFITLSVIL